MVMPSHTFHCLLPASKTSYIEMMPIRKIGAQIQIGITMIVHRRPAQTLMAPVQAKSIVAYDDSCKLDLKGHIQLV